MFHKEIYLRRRELLKKNFDGDLLLFLGNEESPMNYKDNTYYFRQDSSFLYYFGGVRNEEDFLITENGHKVLGKHLAKTIEEVEAERAKAF